MKGSNDGTTWTTIDSKDDIAKTFAVEWEQKEFTVSTTTAYRYFRLEVENVGPNGVGRGSMNRDGTPNYTDVSVVISELSLFGEEYVEEKTKP